MMEPKILVVDDDSDDFDVLRLAFRPAENMLVYAGNGPQALDYLDKAFDSSHLPHLIVIDINMPVEDGVSLTKRIMNDKRFAGIPTLIYSSSFAGHAEALLKQIGVKHFMSKPASVEELKKVAAVLLAFTK